MYELLNHHREVAPLSTVPCLASCLRRSRDQGTADDRAVENGSQMTYIATQRPCYATFIVPQSATSPASCFAIIVLAIAKIAFSITKAGIYPINAP